MRRFLAVIAFLLLLFSSCSAEELSVYSTGHFDFSFPSDWHPIDDLPGFFRGSDGEVVMCYENSFQSGGLSLSVLYDAMETGLMDGIDGEQLRSQEITIDERIARMILTRQVLNSSSQYVCYTFLYVDGNVAYLALIAPDTADEDHLTATALSLAQRIRLSSSASLQDIARLAFDDNLIAVKQVDSSGYIFIETELRGMDADSMIANLEKDATNFLRDLRNLVEAGTVDFTEVSFQGYTNVIDVYGNESHDNVIQFWITKETLFKINFDRFDPANMSKIDLNRYVGPVMLK